MQSSIFRPCLLYTSFDEMHVDGGTTAALFIAPELASLLPVGSNLLDGANVYIIVNGQFGAGNETTPLRTCLLYTSRCV